MEKSKSKINCMTLVKQPLCCKLVKDNATIHQAPSFKYLKCRLINTGLCQDPLRIAGNQHHRAASKKPILNRPFAFKKKNNFRLIYQLGNYWLGENILRLLKNDKTLHFSHWRPGSIAR